MKELLPGVFIQDGKNYTKNLVPGKSVYGEKLVGKYREWIPFRSKLSAAIARGLKTFPFTSESKVLYLGAAQGTTPSHISDICPKGVIVAVEISQKAFEKLLPLCEERENILPVLADAGHPKEYEEYGPFDIIYQDIAQAKQAKIIVSNLPLLKSGGYVFLAIKARSIDVTKDPKIIFEEEKAVLIAADLEILETIVLDPFEKDHAMVVARKP